MSEQQQPEPVPVQVPAEKRMQAGVEILVGKCPRCHRVFGISGCENGRGRHHHDCGTLVEFVEKDGSQ